MADGFTVDLNEAAKACDRTTWSLPNAATMLRIPIDLTARLADTDLLQGVYTHRGSVGFRAVTVVGRPASALGAARTAGWWWGSPTSRVGG